jgi:hypothetical protein
VLEVAATVRTPLLATNVASASAPSVVRDFIPNSFEEAMADVNWQTWWRAMCDEMGSCEGFGVWGAAESSRSSETTFARFAR